MKLLILSIGKVKSKPVQELVDDYAERVGHYVTTALFAAKDERQALGKLEPNDLFIVLDERGKQMGSLELAEFLRDHQLRGTKRIVFFIGGPEGHGERLRERARIVLGLSKMTFPHELTQAILLEQLYRAYTIIKGEPYHK
ncbi:MAG: 23S rRNA (pseudouridine(1915)-N(3))-methyltransferase RlmH [Deltaproteobacteria bacterium]|nr:23S rRNA (pseudouridine(1915)-N(3))-methyltransferase RlmH [Deltaproteobacteria bacterium]